MAGVPSASAYLLFWLYMGLGAAACRGLGEEGARAPTRGRPYQDGGCGLAPTDEDGRREGEGCPSHGGRRGGGRGPRGRPRFLGALASGLLAVAMLSAAGFGIVRLNALPIAADVAAARGSDLAERGHFAAAREAYHQAIGLGPHAEYHLLLGQMALQAAERAPAAEAERWLREAEESLREAERLDPLDLDVALAQGKLYQTRATRPGSASDWPAAEAAFRRALALSPYRSYVHNRYGAVLAAQGRHGEALAEYRVSLALDSRYAATHGFLGDSLVALGRPREAASAYEEGRRLDPSLILVRINLGELYLRMGRTAEAVGEYAAAVALAPNDAALRQRLAEIQRGAR